MNPTNMTWQYGQVRSNALNVRREPSRKARRWNNVWPMNRLVLVRHCAVDGWYEHSIVADLLMSWLTSSSSWMNPCRRILWNA